MNSTPPSWMQPRAAGTISDRTGKRAVKTETDAERRERRLAAEHAVWRILASADRLEGVVPSILKEVCRAGAWALGELWTPGDDGQILHLTDVWNDTLFDLDRFVEVSWVTTFPSGTGLPGRVLETGSPIWIPDVATDHNFPRLKLADEAGLHAAFGFPIRIHGQVKGVMAFYSPEFRQPDPELLESLDVIGGQIGHFIERSRTFQALAESEARWQRILSGAPFGIFHSTMDGKLLDVNPAFAAMLGFASPQDAIDAVNRTSIPQALYVDPNERDDFLQRLRQQPGNWISAEVQGRRTDGTTVIGELHVKWLYEYFGRSPVIEGFVTDITERKRMEKELRSALDRVRELTLRDHLTGLHNRRHLEDRLAIEMAAARRTGDDISIIMLDIDFFKRINDTHGHQVGDIALQALAMTLAADVRPEDVLARYGGEEFVLLLRQTGPREAWDAAERLRRMVMTRPVGVSFGEIRITISCGVASLSECGARDQDCLMQAADQRLYQAKAQGRNRTCGAGVLEDIPDFVL